eukprot:scaffold11375_cov123-Isochrysis_galbana.AAC.7
MDEASKLEWYKATKNYPHSPFARQTPFINQRDQHFSNEGVEQSLLQEADNNIGLCTPGHHNGALQHMDLRDGSVPDGYNEWRDNAAAAAATLLRTAPTAAAAPAVAANAAAQSPARAAKCKAADAIRTLAAASTPGMKAVLIAQADAMERA